MNVPPYGDQFNRALLNLANLKVRAQSTPNMTVKISAGGFWSYDSTGSTFVEYAGGDSASIAIPGPAGNAKWTILTLNTSGAVIIIDGAISHTPVLPTIPRGRFPLAAIYIMASDTKITEDMIFDIRPMFELSVKDHRDLTATGVAGSHPASAVTFDPSGAGMISDTVQDAIPELKTLLDDAIAHMGTSGSSGTSGSGTAGTSGTSGNSGTSGTSGNSGTSGTSGTSSDGTSGSSGTSGATGTSGTSGIAGTSGSSGTSGQKGEAFQIDTSGELNVSIVSFIEASGATPDDVYVYLVTDDNRSPKTDPPGISGDMSKHVVMYDGTGHALGWHDYGQFTGLPGTSGTSGSSGEAGSSGTSGSSGETGTSGTSGIDGTSGTSGIDGTSGTSGIDGTSGTSGIDGTSGTDGTSGIDGTSGTSTILDMPTADFDVLLGTAGTSGTSWIRVSQDEFRTIMGIGTFGGEWE